MSASKSLIQNISDISTGVSKDFNILDDEYLRSQFDYDNVRCKENLTRNNHPMGRGNIPSNIAVQTSDNVSRKTKTPYKPTGFARIIDNVASTNISKIANMETSVKITPNPTKIDIPSMPCNMNTPSSISEEAWGHGWEDSPTTRWDNHSENDTRAIGYKRSRRSPSDHSCSQR